MSEEPVVLSDSTSLADMAKSAPTPAALSLAADLLAKPVSDPVSFSPEAIMDKPLTKPARKRARHNRKMVS